jgi:signal transduction histidine kinase
MTAPDMSDRLRAWSDRLRTVPPGRVDLVVAVVVTLATVVPTLLPTPREWWVVILACFASVPVFWRRRAPIRVSIVLGVAMTALVIWQKPLLPYGPLVGVYTIAALSPPLLRLVAIPLIGAGVYLSLALPHEALDIYRAVGMAFVAAYALGTSERARRSRAAELAERTRRLTQEWAAATALERTRIARDMHDIVTHSVGLMVVQAEAGPVVTHSDPARAEAVFDSIADTGRDALTQLRSLLGALRSADGSNKSGAQGPAPGLETIPDLVQQTSKAGVPVTLTIDGDPRPVRPEVDVAAYRIVQEALTNVLRHANAQSAQVHVDWSDTILSIAITDDGQSTPDSADDSAAGPGHGLIGMRERATACGGSLQAGPLSTPPPTPTPPNVGPPSPAPPSAGPPSAVAPSAGPPSAGLPGDARPSAGPSGAGPASAGPVGIAAQGAGPLSGGLQGVAPPKSAPSSAGPHRVGPPGAAPQDVALPTTVPRGAGPPGVAPHNDALPGAAPQDAVAPNAALPNAAPPSAAPSSAASRHGGPQHSRPGHPLHNPPGRLHHARPDRPLHTPGCQPLYIPPGPGYRARPGRTGFFVIATLPVG